MAQLTLREDQVVIAIDPHKASWTAAVVDAHLQPVQTVRVEVNRDGYRDDAPRCVRRVDENDTQRSISFNGH